MLLGIDLGTSGVKAGLFDRDGRLRGLGRGTGYRFASPKPGWAECDAEGWWPAIVEAVRAALAEGGDPCAAGGDPCAAGGDPCAAGGDPCAAGGAFEAARRAAADPGGAGARVEGIGLSTFFPAVIPIGHDGRPLRPGLLYCDQRSTAQVRAIERLFPRRRWERLTGNRLACGNIAVTSMLWLRDNESERYEEAATLAFANTFVTQRLSGQVVTDWTTASLSGLAEVADPSRWNERLCATLGVATAKLPRIVGPMEPAGTLEARAASDLGLPSGIPVVCGAGDTAASAFGAGLLEPGGILYSAGTTDNLSIVLPRPTEDRTWITVGYVQPGRWLEIGANAAGGLSLDWLAREVLGREGGAGMEEILRLAEDAPSGRIVYLPYLQGERMPLWDPLARGMFLGLTAATTRGELVRAVLEGGACSLRHMLEPLEAMVGGRIVSLPAVGGGTRSGLWNRIKADVLQRPLDVLRFQETAALGAALMAGVGSGVYGSAAAAIEAVAGTRGSDRVEPDPRRAAAYDRLYRAYRDAYERTRDLVHALPAG